MAKYNMDTIEAISENEARAMALESLEIKGHNVYFVDLGEPYGFSRLVFAEGRHIYFANDYELHHRNRPREELRALYIEGANNKLFTEAELAETPKDYSEYERKDFFLRNYYSMRRPYITAFYIGDKPTIPEGYTYSPLSIAYFQDGEFVKHQLELAKTLAGALAAASEGYEFQVGAFYYAMCNHEYGINWEADYDVLREFGALRYCGEAENELECYFDQLGFSKGKRRAYMEARKRYFKGHMDMF